MANEISVSAAMSCARDLITVQASGSKTMNQTGTKAIMNQFTVTTGPAAMINTTTLPIANLGCLFVKNLDASGSVELSMESAVTSPFAKLLAGDFCLISVNKSSVPTIYARASVSLSVLVCASEI